MPSLKLRSGERKLAAPTLTRPDSLPSSSAPAPAPAKKKVTKKTGGKKRKEKALAQEDKSLEVGSEEWIEEQRRLTQIMTRMYDKPWDSARDDEEDDDEEDDEDVLAYFDHEAEAAKTAEEERKRQERIAEFKRVSSLPIKGVPSSSRTPRGRPAIPRAPQSVPLAAAAASSAGGSPQLSPKVDAASSEEEAELEPEPAFDLSDSAADASSRPASQTSPPPMEIEPFCVGRRPNSFEEIEVTVEPTSKTLAAVRAGVVPSGSGGSPRVTDETDSSSSPHAGSVATLTTGMSKLASPSESSSAEPPLTPRSMASAMAARRLANMQLRADGQPMRVRTAPTGGS